MAAAARSTADADRSAPAGSDADLGSAASASPLHVAYLMSRFPKLTETFVLDEILELERRGVAVSVFPLWRTREELVHDDARAVVGRAHFLPMLNARILADNLASLFRSPRRYLGTLWTLVRANRSSPRFLLAALAVFPKSCSVALRLRSLGVTHVHAHFASHPAAAAFVIGRFSGLPWSFTAHGSDLHRAQAMLREKVDEARWVVTISEYNRAFILDRVDHRASEKIRVIHCGVDLEDFAPAKSKSDALTVVCIGTLHEVKGQRFLLEACAALASRDIRFQLHLVGDGPDRARLEARADELGIASDVIFHGALERTGVRRVLEVADIAVAPSVASADGRREGIPVALMEAAASGLPLVASRLSGIPELVIEQETGLLAEPGDVSQLTSALMRLADDPALRARLGRAARARVEGDFSLSGTVTRLEQIFRGEAAT